MLGKVGYRGKRAQAHSYCRTQPWVMARSPKRSLESQRLWKDQTCCLPSPTKVIPPPPQPEPILLRCLVSRQLFALSFPDCIMLDHFAVPHQVHCSLVLLLSYLHDCSALFFPVLNVGFFQQPVIAQRRTPSQSIPPSSRWQVTVPVSSASKPTP